MDIQPVDPTLISPDAIRTLERHMLEMPQVDLQTQQLVHGGMYARTIFIPAGTCLTGAETALDNICIVMGDISVTTDKGMVRLQGYNVLPAGHGVKRVGLSHADTWWTTLWATDKTDLQEIEDQVVTESNMLQTRREGITFEERPALREH